MAQWRKSKSLAGQLSILERQGTQVEKKDSQLEGEGSLQFKSSKALRRSHSLPADNRMKSVVEAASGLFHTPAKLGKSISQSLSQKAAVDLQLPVGRNRYSCQVQHSISSFYLEDEKADRMRSLLGRMVLLPSSPFLLYWDIIFVFGSLLVTGVLFPCIMVFEQLNGMVSMVVGLALSVLFTLDTMLHFFRAVKVSTREGVVLVTYLPDICQIYLRGMFILDALSACPFFLLTLVDRHSKLLLLIRIGMPMLRFVRFPRLMVHLQAMTRWSFQFINILEFALISFLVLHWIACVWASLGSSESSWLSVARTNYQFLEADDYNDARLYVVSLYWSVTVLTSVGFGDISPQNWWEFVVATICMSIGGGVWAFVVGSVCGMACEIDKHRNAFESQMNDVEGILKEQKLPMNLQDRVRDFYKHAKDCMRMKMYHDTIRDLSPALKGEVISYMYGSCFRRVWYFDVLDEVPKCALVLAEGMVPRMYAPEELIEDSVDTARALVFLRSGLCVRKNNLLAPGAVWGLDVILGSEEHEDIEELLDTVLARSLNFVFVLKLSKLCIDHAASLSPAFARRLRRAHCRMLLWRGVIAASRAEQRLMESQKHPETQTQVSHWDRLGKLMGQVVHRDRLLLEDQNDPLHSHHLGTHIRRGSRNLHLLRLNTADSSASGMSRQVSASELDQQISGMSRQNTLGSDANDDWGLPNQHCVPTVPSLTPRVHLPHRRPKSSTQMSRRESREMRMSIAEEVAPEDLGSEASSEGRSSESKESSVQVLLGNWKADVKKGLRKHAAKLKSFRSEVQTDVENIREEVQQLHRLMHQLLARLDAEEKY